METSHSLLSGNPAGRILLALKQTGNHAWDLCAIEVRKGKVSWCSPLSRRADVALSVVGDKAIAHDPAGYIFAYDLGTGHRAWNTKLDCEIGPGHLRAVGAETAVGTCARPSMASVDAWKVDLVAIDLKTGEVRWRNAQASQWGRFYLDGEKLIAYFSSPDRSIVPLAKPRLGSRKARSVDRGGVAPRVKRDWNALVGSRLSQWTVLDALTGKTLPRAVLSGAVSSAADAAGDVSVVVSPLFSEDVAFASAFCSWLERSALPEAKTVMAEHDRAMNAPGAWKALCESNSF
jgi:outer membrane protein assembly factor BamB